MAASNILPASYRLRRPTVPVHDNKTHNLCKEAALPCINKDDDDKLTSLRLQLGLPTHIHEKRM